MTGIMTVGLIYIVIAFIIKFVGKDWLDKLLPPVVIGPMIMIIGLGLAPSAISQIGLNSGTAFDINTFIVAVVSFLVTALLMTKAKGFFKVIPFLIGIISGYVVAVCLGMIDFKPVAEASFFSFPNFKFVFLDYKLNFTALLTIAPIALVTLCEHIGDHTSLGNIIGKDLIKDPGLDRTLLGDGIATLVAGAMGGPANTTYGENTSVVGMTKVASVKVIELAAVIAILIAFLGKFTALVSTIPNAVLGGVSLLLYGFIAVNGLKVLIKNQVNFEDSKNVIVASTMLVLGLGGAVIAITTKDMSLTVSGMSLASVVGILLNAFLPEDNSTCKEQETKELNIKNKDINNLKDEIKNELTVELKEEVIKQINEEMNKTTRKKK